MTYAELKSLIQNYLENTETTFVSDLPKIIEQAETRILKSVKLPVFRKNVEGSITSGNKYLNTPSDFLDNYSLALTNSDSQEFLLFKDVNFIREAYPNPSTTGVPKHYALFDNTTFILKQTESSAMEKILFVIISWFDGPVFPAISLVPASINTIAGFKLITSCLNLSNI